MFLHKDDDQTSVSHPLTPDQSQLPSPEWCTSSASSARWSHHAVSSSVCFSPVLNAVQLNTRACECPFGQTKEIRTQGLRRTLHVSIMVFGISSAGFGAASRQRLPRQQTAAATGTVPAPAVEGRGPCSHTLISTDKNEAKQLKHFNGAFFTSSIRDNEGLGRISAFSVLFID